MLYGGKEPKSLRRESPWLKIRDEESQVLILGNWSLESWENSKRGE